MAVPDVSEQSIESLVSLRGRAAVVTGGARGLGLAIARRLGEAGASVLLGDVDQPAVMAAAEAIGADGTDARGIHLDVTDSISVAAAADRAVEDFGAVDIWVNNAGIYPFTPSLELTDAQWDRVVAVNLRGTFLGCREAARRMVRAGRPGVIINLSSIAGYKGSGPGVAHYVSTKHAVRGLTKQLALELADHGIRVLGIAPTRIMTPGVEQAMAGQLASADFDFDKTLRGPLGRVGVPDDVARVVLFCVSDLALFMTGSTLAVDAGELAR